MANQRATVQLEHGKARVINGSTGKPLVARVTVGYQYLLKLNHLVEDKLHAREEGDYAAWVEQPVKGRKAGGGQRVGEMETWALEAHNTPELLRELLTYKSDDVMTRQHAWEAVEKAWIPNYLPESFRVTAFLLRGLGLKLEVYKNGAHEPEELTYQAKINARDIAHLRLSIATQDDIRRWGPREVRMLRVPHRPKSVSWACACSGNKGLRGENNKGKTCPRCNKAVQRHVRAFKPAATQDVLLSDDVFGTAGERRYTMAHVQLAVPMVNPLFMGALSRLLRQDIRPFVEFERFWLPEMGHDLSWRELQEQQAMQTPVLSGAEYILHRLDQLPCPPPAWEPRATILTLLPIIPPALRPVLQRPDNTIESDLNPLYRRVLRTNAQLTALLQRDSTASAAQVYRAKRRLQHAINALFVAGHDGRVQHERSIRELLQGKDGILRQHVLGKRTNYSGRAVIVPGPDLTLDACRLPAALVTGMFKHPLVHALRKERRMRPEQAEAVVASQSPSELESLLADRVVLLNRAPSLHRYNILAFRPQLWNEPALALHPLVCSGFNADFDGDTMAIHMPLLGNSREEALRCLPSRHLLSIASGRLLLHITQDIVAGVYCKTMTEAGRQEFTQVFDAPDVVSEIEQPIDKDTLLDYLTRYMREYGEEQAVQKADALMRWGFTAATEAGLTLSLWDIPWITKQRRCQLLETLLQEQGLSWAAFERMKRQGGSTYERHMESWKQRVEKAIEDDLVKSRAHNPLAVIILSKARGKFADACQLGGLRGLMDKLGGERFREPVDANFLEGLSPLEFFISAFGSRKTMVDKKLKTADAGDLTRRLVEAAYPLVISQEGACASAAGLVLQAAEPHAGEQPIPLAQRLFGRVLADDVFDKNNHRVALKGEVVGSVERAATIVQDADATRGIAVRSPLTCQADGGICQHCYGWDVSRWYAQPEATRFPELGLPIGIIAGQCIGERGTQLTMRTFHTGGVKGEDITQGLPRVKRLVEGWLDLRLFTVTDPRDSGREHDQPIDAWEWYQLQAQGGRLPEVAEREGHTRTLRLADFLKTNGLAELSRLFLWLMHQVYGEDVDSRHFEVILRAMLVFKDGSVRLRGVTRAAMERQGFLATAAFQRALDVLVQAATEGREDWLKGYKERLMVGQAMR